MNEQIIEMAIKAGFNPVNCTGSNVPLFEKFAELIIRECIGQGDTLANHYINTHSDQEQVLLLASIADYSNEIKKHFGVEE